MADNTAALVVALSAQLTKFEKDMKDAGVIADKGVKDIEKKFDGLANSIGKKLTESLKEFAKSAGPLGGVLVALGPAGLAAAAAIAAVVTAVVALSEATDAYVEKQVKLKEGADTLGVNISQLKAMGEAGRQVGIDLEATQKFMSTFLTGLEQLRRGSGPLFDALVRIDTGLVRELATARNSAEAIDVLVRAYSRLTDQTEKLALARAAGGRGGAEGVRLLQELSQGGGVAPIKTGDADAMNARLTKLKQNIDDIKKQTADVWGKMFAPETLESQKKSAEFWLSIAEAVERAMKFRGQAWPEISGAATGIDKPPAPGASKGDRLPVSTEPTLVDRIAGDVAALEQASQKMAKVVEADRERKASLEVNLALEKRNNAVLGEAATQTELLKTKKDELAVASEKDHISTVITTRALNDYIAAQRIAAEAVRERYGVVTEGQIAEARLLQLSRDAAKYGLTENEMLQAKTLILKEAKTAADALAVRKAYLPGLKQLELDANNLQKNLDNLAVSGLNSFTDEMAAAVVGTKSLSQAFSDMTKSILSDLAKMVIRQQITGPLASLFGGSFGGGGGPTGTIQVGDQFFPKFAGGTNSAPGGWSIVGENGPELMKVPHGAQIVPNDIARSSLGGGGAIVYSPAIDARGASVEAVARLAQIIEQDRAMFASRTIATIQQARRGRVAGL